MALNAHELRRRTVDIAKHPRTRKGALWAVAIFIAIGVLLGLAAPPLIRGKLAAALSDKLHREISIEQLRFNPYTMKATVRGFLMKERQAQTPAMSFDELLVNLEFQSLWRLAPVIKQLRLVKPYVSIVRDENRKYNYQDLIDEFSGGPPGPTPRFALNNIEIIDGKLDIDDRPEQTKHTVTQLKIGVPFISSLPSHVDITVKPEFSAVINGAPFHLAGDTVPFKDSRESTLHLDINNVEIPKYLEYSPVVLNFTMPSGQLNGKLTALFRTSKDNPPVLSINGNLGLKDLELRQNGDATLLKLPTLDVTLGAIEVFANRATLKSVKSQGLELHLIRGRDGKLNVASLIAPAAESQPSAAKPEAKKEDKPFIYTVDEIALGGSTIHLTDEQTKGPYKKRLDNFTVKVAGLSNETEKKAKVEISFESEAKEKFSHAGTLQITPLLAEGKLEIEALQLKGLRPYYQDVIGVEFKDGLLDLTTQVAFVQKGEEPDVKLLELNAALRSLRLDVPGESEPLWRVPLLALKDVTVDINKRSVVIGAIESRDGSGSVQREQDGAISYARLIKTRAADSHTKQPVKEEEASWSVETKRIALSRFKIAFEDRSLATPARIVASGLSFRGENFSNVQNSRGKATLQTTINDKGTLKFAGVVGVRPVAGRLEVEAQGIDVLPFRPYLVDQVNFLLTSGMIGTKGTLVFDTSGDGPPKVNYAGGAQVLEFGAVETDGQQDLLKWKSLSLDALQFDLEPFQLRVGEITLADFYSRLILGADGKMNLQKLTGQKDEAPAPAKAAEKVPAPAPAKVAEKSAAPAATEAAPPKAISIGKINLQEGNIYFSDFFIKPNYSANLTSVQGAISELKPEAPGDLDLHARLDNAAPVEVKGKINPLSKELFLDIIADAKDIELSPMSPYSGKYVGYGIEKGKLSFTVKYKVDNRKLSAENKIILNQLTFGEKIESPDATKLPVLLAVALMKDRNGVIDVDLPISGSLDDPQFSVGGIVLRIIINLITRAVTAPFSLIASAFGGGGSGDELSYIEFDPGRANLDKTDQAKIATLAKALNNRPALSLEISGRVDALTDLDGLKRVGIERKVKAQKMRDLARRGEAPRSVEDVQVPAAEYQQYLKAAYGEESFPKPRNVIGLAQDLPVPEMEKLMMQHAKVADDEMRQLANQRAQAVRDALMTAGQVGADRLFVVAAKPLSTEERAKLKGRPNRVDFSMK